jgi:hypothetical protein
MKFDLCRVATFLILGFSACLGTHQAGATTVCVDSATALFNDLKAYSDGGAHSGDDLEIRLVIGEYDVGSATGNKAFTYHSTAASGYVSIQGGWADDCAYQVPGAEDVTLDGGAKAQVLKIDNEFGGVYVDQLIIQNGVTDAQGAGLAINTGVSGGGLVQVLRCIIQNNYTSTTVGGLAAYASGASNFLQISDNLIINNIADSEYGAAYTDGDSVMYNFVLNNTVYGNTTAAGTVGGFVAGGRSSPSDSVFVSSNIFYGNTHTGLYMIGEAGTVDYNDYGSIDGVVPEEMIGNVSVAPKFVDAAGGDFHLSSASPLIGLTTKVLGGYCDPYSDLDGHQRDFYSGCDPGPYEETIFRGGFQELK